jgi:hypothetical protein
MKKTKRIKIYRNNKNNNNNKKNNNNKSINKKSINKKSINNKSINNKNNNKKMKGGLNDVENCLKWADEKEPTNPDSNFHKLCKVILEEGHKLTEEERIKNFEEMLHIYFNDGSIIEEIYKSMKSKDFCFLHTIYLDILKEKFEMVNHIGKKNETIVDFDMNDYSANELDSCAIDNNTFAIPIVFRLGNISHENMLIIQENFPTKIVVEHFEPHGKRFLLGGNEEENIKINKIINEQIKYLIDGLFGGDYEEIEIITPKDTCPYSLGLQGMVKDSNEWKGTCAIFSMWYAFLRLQQPEKSYTDIYKYMYDVFEKDNPIDIIHKIVLSFTNLIHIDTLSNKVGTDRILTKAVVEKIKTLKENKKEEENLMISSVIEDLLQNDPTKTQIFLQKVQKENLIEILKALLKNNTIIHIKLSNMYDKSIFLDKRVLSLLIEIITRENPPSSLKYLNISNNIISAEDLQQIIIAIDKSKNFKALNIKDIGIGNYPPNIRDEIIGTLRELIKRKNKDLTEKEEKFNVVIK